MFLLVNGRGIVAITDRGFFKKLLCRHSPIVGEHCSGSGLTRISGIDTYSVCEKCGKVLGELHT